MKQNWSIDNWTGAIKDDESFSEIGLINQSHHDYEANAALICAAPDLLKALQKLIPIANELCSKCCPDNLDLTGYDLAKAAILKATTPTK